MESVLALPSIKQIFDKYFVIQAITTMESQDKKNLENAGSQGLMEANGGKNAGLPFFYISDPKGKMLINSIRPANGADKGGNTGCPYEPVEIDHFMKMLAVSAPKMTSAEAKTIRDGFEALKKPKSNSVR